MKIVFLGTPQFAVPSLERLIQHEAFDMVGVVTQPDKRRGRGNDLIPSPVKSVALSHQLPVWQPRRIKKEAEVLAQLRAAEADAFVVVAYGQILSQEILDMPRWGCINAHGSLLPKYRGAAPIQWSLYFGESQTGITTMLMDAGMDTGAMLLKSVIPIAPLDNAVDLAQTLSLSAAELLVETLLGLQQSTLQPIPQDNAEATYAPLIQKADYRLDWSKSAIALHNQIRGFYPHCVTSLRHQPLKVTATVPIAPVAEHLPEAEPGTVINLLKGQGAVIQTGDGALLLKEAQLAGKRSQSGWDFVNGARLQIGEVLGKEAGDRESGDGEVVE